MTDERKEYTLKEGAEHLVLVKDPERKRGHRRVMRVAGQKVKLSAAGASAISDKLVEFEEKPEKKAPAKKKAAGKKKVAAAAAS